jgi:hypothetical protein
LKGRKRVERKEKGQKGSERVKKEGKGSKGSVVDTKEKSERFCVKLGFKNHCKKKKVEGLDETPLFLDKSQKNRIHVFGNQMEIVDFRSSAIFDW